MLIVAVAINLGVLAYFKYANFLVATFNYVSAATLPVGEIVLPLGISFFTFTQVALLADAYYGKVRECSFVHYGPLVTYFPHLIAGPVLHHAEMMPQFAQRATYRISAEKLAAFAAYQTGTRYLGARPGADYYRCRGIGAFRLRCA